MNGPFVKILPASTGTAVQPFCATSSVAMLKKLVLVEMVCLIVGSMNAGGGWGRMSYLYLPLEVCQQRALSLEKAELLRKHDIVHFEFRSDMKLFPESDHSKQWGLWSTQQLSFVGVRSALGVVRDVRP